MVEFRACLNKGMESKSRTCVTVHLLRFTIARSMLLRLWVCMTSEWIMPQVVMSVEVHRVEGMATASETFPAGMEIAARHPGIELEGEQPMDFTQFALQEFLGHFQKEQQVSDIAMLTIVREVMTLHLKVVANGLPPTLRCFPCLGCSPWLFWTSDCRGSSKKPPSPRSG